MNVTLGTRAFEVEWCEGCPLDENGDADLDRADYRFKVVKTLAAARRLAKQMLPRDFFGSVRITEVELSDELGCGIPRAFMWEAVGESEFESGDENP